MTREKVYVAVLNQGTTSAGLETQLFAWMRQMNDRYIFDIHFPAYKPIPNTRHHIVKDFLAGDYDRLVMIDDDNPPHRNIFELLDFDKPVIGGVYPGRSKSGIHFHVYRQDGDVFKQYPPEFREGLKQVDAIGTGLICIKREVLEQIKKPFEDIFYEDGTLHYSDDMGFCLKCKEKDIPIYAHFGYIGSHFKNVDLLWIADLVAYAAHTGRTNYGTGPKQTRKE